MTYFDFAVISHSHREKSFVRPKSPQRSTAAGIQNKLLTGTTIVIHSEKEPFLANDTGNIKEKFFSEVAPT